MTLGYGLIFASIVLLAGVLGITLLGNSNLIMLIISLELILLSVAIFLVHFSFILDDTMGAAFTLILLPLAGAESVIALTLLISYAPTRGTLLIAA